LAQVEDDAQSHVFAAEVTCAASTLSLLSPAFTSKHIRPSVQFRSPQILMHSKRNMLQEWQKNEPLCSYLISLSLYHTFIPCMLKSSFPLLTKTTVPLKLPNCVLFGTNQGRNFQNIQIKDQEF
jgi:hypothetical protein